MSILTLAAMMCTVTSFPGTLLSMACQNMRFGPAGLFLMKPIAQSFGIRVKWHDCRQLLFHASLSISMLATMYCQDGATSVSQSLSHLLVFLLDELQGRHSLSIWAIVFREAFLQALPREMSARMVFHITLSC